MYMCSAKIVMYSPARACCNGAMDSTEPTALLAHGHPVDRSSKSFGTLRGSTPGTDVATLRRRMNDDGYLYLPGLLDPAAVNTAREAILLRLAELGVLMPGSNPSEAIANPRCSRNIAPDVANSCDELEGLLYEGRMIEFFARFLGGDVRHFDYTWLRTIPPGHGTPSHCDIVYMGRGTPRLYTAWTPLGDVGFDLGGLMILEGSNNHRRLRQTYGSYDVDTYCENRPEITGWKRNGHLSENPNQIRRSLGGRWLTNEFRSGDVVVFSAFTVHASLDNRSDRIRLSSDSRYQLASESVDERWIGPNPVAHSQSGKRGRIC